MSNRWFTVMVVPERSSRVTRFKLSRNVLVNGVVAVSALLVVATMLLFHYLHVMERVDENAGLREANVVLQSDIRRVEGQVSSIRRTLDRVRRFDTKLRVLTQLSDPDRNLAIGPLAPRNLEPYPADPEDDIFRVWQESEAFLAGDAQNMRIDVLATKIEDTAGEAMQREESLRDLDAFFEDRKALLSSTPSVLPSHGWLTSCFGFRTDPYTGEQHMHNGIDVANAHGTPVLAPADGTVVFRGNKGGFGKTLVIDHGFGVRTVYGHLGEAFVDVNQDVRRGDRVAAVGNTGRSSGPHLHYEVRVHGIPVNPEKYILEDGIEGFIE